MCKGHNDRNLREGRLAIVRHSQLTILLEERYSYVMNGKFKFVKPDDWMLLLSNL